MTASVSTSEDHLLLEWSCENMDLRALQLEPGVCQLKRLHRYAVASRTIRERTLQFYRKFPRVLLREMIVRAGGIDDIPSGIVSEQIRFLLKRLLPVMGEDGVRRMLAEKISDWFVVSGKEVQLTEHSVVIPMLKTEIDFVGNDDLLLNEEFASAVIEVLFVTSYYSRWMVKVVFREPSDVEEKPERSDVHSRIRSMLWVFGSGILKVWRRILNGKHFILRLPFYNKRKDVNNDEGQSMEESES